MNDDYSDIIGLPHHQSATRPRMSVADRAAQFAPFAALTGHGAVIRNTADRHVADVNTQQFETDALLSLLAGNEDAEF